MNHLDLFSGIGGFALAASWVWGEEHEIVSFVEIDPFCQKVLKKHWPDVPIHSDIKEYRHDGTKIDILTGGWPCQPFSVAASNKRKFRQDERYLWPAMLEQIREIRPTWIIGENVTGILGMELSSVLDDLEGEEYKCQTFLIPAGSVGANHRRNRIWLVANSNSNGLEGWEGKPEKGAISVASRISGWEKDLLPKPVVFRVDDGISARLVKHRKQRTIALGNAIVPQVVVPIFQSIKTIMDNNVDYERFKEPRGD